MRRTRTTLKLLSLITLLSLLGCGGKKEGADAGGQSPAPEPSAQVTEASDSNPVPAITPQVNAAKTRLVGTWTGQMEVNARKVAETLRARQTKDQKIEDKDIQQAIALLRSLKMRIDFRADGGMNLDATLDEGQKTTEAKGVGRWELLHVKKDDVLIRSIETGKEPEEVQLHFENDSEFSMQPPKEYAGIGMMRFHKLR